ncbi:myomegalin isoform X8 [Phyllopteryx taeniolatus]|uniref:myomegalin isoform X8 n=1 Tax=Phyllopteryx taeniolatus TaxID=161469 RepID=UPI002AD53ECE|nr:myomegalin isoform X8 [Phyllopteryx taeniolatus]
MLDNKMKETCRICGRDLCGNQRRWIFHPTAKLNLQVLLSHALGQELGRDGRGEFVCSKCAFMLDRMYRFDTVIARVEALSIERLQRLLQEKHRLRQCIGGLYRKTNLLENALTSAEDGDAPGDGMVDISGLTHAKYCALLQEDLVYSLYESWADDSVECHHHHHPQSSAGLGSEVAGSHRCIATTPRKCQGCSHWRVADSDYEAVCKVPRKLARSTSCGPSTRYSASVIGGSGGGAEVEEKENGDEPDEPPSSLTLVPGSQDVSRTSDSDRTLAGRASSSPSIASLETTEEYIQPECMTDELLNSPKDQISDTTPEGPPHGQSFPAPSFSVALCLLQNYAVHRPVQSTKGSKIPVLLKRSSNHGRLDFPYPVLELTFGSPGGDRYHRMPTPELEAPLIQLHVGPDRGLNSAGIEDFSEDVYIEYPPPNPHQNLVEEQQSQLNQYECAAGQCVSELQKAQLQVQSLQAKIHESDSNNMKLQEKLSEMECELHSLRQAARSQERTIRDLTESISTKDCEAQELYQLVEGQNVTLYKLREMAHRNQLTQSKAAEWVSESVTLAQLQGELVGVQSSLFSLGLELEASQRSLRQSQRQGKDLARFKDRLNADLQEALQHREETEKYNQDLRCTLQKIRAELQAKEKALKEAVAERLTAVQEKDRSIAQLNHSLQDKERQLQEYSEMIETPESSKPRDALLEKLRERIKDRDRALECSIDDKFRCLDEREGQVRTLQLALREKDRDLDRLRCILTNNEETITSLDALVRGKEVELEQAAEAYRNLQWLKQQSEEKETNALREKDTIIGQLQAALQARSKETQDLTGALVARVHAGPTEVVEELKARLQLKEKLFQELLSDRSRQSSEHQTRVLDLLNTLSAKDQYLQDNSYRLSLVISERTGQLQEVRRQLSQREQELCELNRDKQRETGGEVQHLQGLLREKEALLKEMMQSQEEVMMQSSTESEENVKALQEELQLILKKEMEAQRELSALRSSLAAQQAKRVATESTEHVLEQLVSEYRQLNGALRAEKRLYQSLNHATGDSSSDKILALHTQLDSVQALRGQLEEVLARIQNMALELERAAKRQPDLGDVSSGEEEEGDDEDGSSDEFTDSIEEDEKVTSASLPSNQTKRPCGHEEECGFLRTSTQTVELELKEIQSQLEREGFTSVTQMRSTLERLQKENLFLKEHQGLGSNHRSLDQGQDDDDTEKEEEEEDYMEDDEEGLTSSMPDKGFKHTGGVSEAELGLREHSARLCSENRELQERLMVSEATVHAQAEQLKDYRDLLTETTVQQASKQVQVDLQDLGYETCGRSENEAEREDASSPEFDDLEMCTSLSHQQEESMGGGWYAAGRNGHNGGAYEEIADKSTLQHLVQDLRSQLTRCHKVIRGLQMRVRSLSATSDYASSLERTSRKVNWAFEMSPAQGGVEEDEGWMSDTQATSLGPKPSRELQKLMARVATLEAQLKSSKLEGKNQAEKGKCATWPGKYNSLIQAQARELSHLRQRMREGEGVSHILTQHLGDTTKAFEELLRANDVDYYMGQSFREQLSQSTALAQRLLTKISGRAESPDDKTGHELLALQLSKELQQKDKIIESLHNKLQHRPETPSSCQALSETTDPSDRTSFVSDECQTNEDLDLCSDLDAREYQDEEQRLQSDQDGFPDLHGKPRFALSPGSPNQCELSGYSQLPHHTFQQYQLGGIPEGHSLKSDSGLLTGGGAFWDMDNMTQPMGNYSGVPGHLLGSSQTGPNVIEEHLREVRCLRQRLEESIRTNERLRQQLEEKLANPGRDGGAPTNIYIQGLDTVTHLSNEIRVLTDENLNLQSRLQASTDSCEELIAARTRLKQAELEAEQWKEELRRLQTHSEEQGQQIHDLRQERQASQEKINRVQHEASLLQQQLGESRELIHSLQTELHVYDRVCSSFKSTKGFLCETPGLPVELGELLSEVRSLRAQLQTSVQENSALKQLELHKQLEQKLGGGSPRTASLSAFSASPQRENFYRRPLLHDPAPSPPVRDIGLFNCGSPCPPYSDQDDSHSTANDPLDLHSELEGDAPDGSFANRYGRHAVGHVDDFTALQQQVLEGRGIVQRMEAALHACLSPPSPLGGTQKQNSEMFLDHGSAKSLLSNTKTLRQILEETASLLKMFWRAALPSADVSIPNLKKEQSMQEEILSLKLRMSEQEEVLKGTIHRLRSTSRTKESMEHFIVNQLSRTRDVLKKARTNLEKNEQRLSSLSSSSSSPYAAEKPGGDAREQPVDVLCLRTDRIKTSQCPAAPVARKRTSQCLL